jgi:hypothetical protein
LVKAYKCCGVDIIDKLQGLMMEIWKLKPLNKFSERTHYGIFLGSQHSCTAIIDSSEPDQTGYTGYIIYI